MKITVLGAGKSGISAAKFAKKLGHEVFLSEYKEVDFSFLEELGISVESGGHSDEIYRSDLCILSPGIKKTLPVVQKFFEKKIEVISEIEFAFRNSTQKMVGITGSNGKTTTTTLLGRIFEKEFGNERIAGNIGIPLSDVVRENDKNPIALELSSFQLENISDFKPSVAMILNISPNHLDWYESIEEYLDAKLLMFKNLSKNSPVVYNLDDKMLGEALKKFDVRKLTFSLKTENSNAFLRNNKIFLNLDKEIELIDLSELKLKGPHHLMNMMAASLAAVLENVSLETIQKILREFDGLEHRMEFVREKDNNIYINDSKSTSIEALRMALQSFEKPIILFAGGKHKGASYKSLRDLIQQNCEKVYVFGQSKDIMFEEWQDIVNIEKVETVFDAVDLAEKQNFAKKIMLFSPACSSFDQFQNFEIRGEKFKEYVNAL
jgi:UDP-N-acetylmuramoylalanine--D-glutamate ligase